MSQATRARLAQLVRRADADLAEAALLVAAEADPTLDVEGTLLRVDALADAARVAGVGTHGDPAREGRALAEALGGPGGFHGHAPGARIPDDALLHRVLERRVGLPITLSVVYVAIGRRLRLTIFPIALPGHVVTGLGGGERPVVLDPFHRGVELDEAAITERVAAATGGRLPFHRAMLRPSPAPDVVRRLLNNLTHDYHAVGRARDALWTVELKLLLPRPVPADHRVRARLLDQLGRFDEAAEAAEAYLEAAGPEVEDAEEVRRAAIRSRSRLN
jgi:regulator of sirC expression with transglutaminase-like and TPR domain